MNLANYKI